MGPPELMPLSIQGPIERGVQRMKRRTLHRATFLLAGIYNLAWGLFTVLDPQFIFRFAGMPLLNHPEIMQCLAMVVGLYGIAYLEVARNPERGFAIAAIGFAGKVLGPIGAVLLVARGIYPPAFLLLNLFNDLIWLAPFAIYLIDAWPLWRGNQQGSA